MYKAVESHRQHLPLVFLLAVFLASHAFCSCRESKRSFDTILRNLNSSDETVRKKAAQELLTAPLPTDNESVTAIARLLVSSDSRVVGAGRDALKRLAGKAVPPLTSILLDRTTPSDLRGEILNLFTDLGPDAKDAVPAILQSLKRPDIDGIERLKGRVALVYIGRDSVPSIVKSFPAFDEEGQRALVDTLEMIVDRDVFRKCLQVPPVYQEAIPLLVQGLTFSNVDMRLSCLKALGQIRPAKEEVVLAIAALSKEEDIGIKMEVARALGLIGPPAKCAARYLEDLLCHRDIGVLIHTMLAVEFIGLQDRVVQRITEIARNGAHPRVREQSVRLLGQTSGPSEAVLRVLQERLEDKNKFVRLLAAQSLARLNPKHPRADEFILQGCKDTDPQVRALAARLLSTLPGNDERLVAALGELLDDSEPFVCMHAAISIWKLKEKARSLTEKLARAVESPAHEDLAPLLAGILRRLDHDNPVARKEPKGKLHLVTSLLTDPVAEWRLCGIEILEAIGVELASVKRELHERTMDEDARVRQAALALLKNTRR